MIAAATRTDARRRQATEIDRLSHLDLQFT